MRAAFYESDITPPLGGYLWGHYNRMHAEDVIDKLYAKAVVTECDGEVAAILAVDTCTLPVDMHDIVTRRITEYTGIPAERICIASNHTHWGAPVCSEPRLNCYADATYLDVFYRLCADTVTLAYRRLQDVQVRFGRTEESGISFNRNYVLKNGTVKTWGAPKEEIAGMFAGIDPELSVMVYEQDGQPMGAVVNFACHQCCCGDIKGYSGDYASYISKELKKVYGPDFVSVFVLGACGDINHINTDPTVKTPPLWYREMGRILAEKAVCAIDTAEDVGEGIKVVKEKIRIPRRLTDPATVNKEAQALFDRYGGAMRANNLLYYHAVNYETATDLWLQTIRIGNTCIYALPGEIFVNLGLDLKKRSPFKNKMVVENSNSYCGYIPTEEAFGENCDLYETSLCMDSCYIPQAGQMMVDRLLEMAD